MLGMELTGGQVLEDFSREGDGREKEVIGAHL